MIHENQTYKHTRSRVKSNNLGDGNVSHPSRRHEILWVIIASHLARMQKHYSMNNSSTTKVEERNTRMREWLNELIQMNMYNSPVGLQTYLQPHHLYWIPTLVGSAVEEKGRENNMRSETYPNWSSSAE